MKRRTFLLFSAAAGVGLSRLFGPAAQAWADPVEVSPNHPRLLIDNFDATRELVATDPNARAWYAAVKEAADAVLDKPVSIYELPDGVRLLSISREVQLRVYLLSMAYAVEGSVNYRDRLWAELQAVCAFPDWHPPHFLDVAEMTHAVAIGYDWWYQEWTAEQRTTMADALINFGLKPGLTVYAKDPWGHDFPRWANNWNVVCNGGLILGALAVADRDADTANAVINNALASLPLALDLYAPDGGWPEGMEYWAYATKYLAVTMAGLTTATGSDSGISSRQGISTTVDFPVHLSGPTGAAWNYYDGSSSAKSPSEIFYLADRFSRPDYAWYAEQGADNQQPSWDELPLYLLWYDPARTKSPIDAGTGLDAQFSRCAVATARSGWQRTDAVYVAGKAGDNATSHSDLDIGTWIYEALGQRWFVDLGSDDYNLPGYFAATRWSYYRKRTEGQNTIVFDPGNDGGQPLDAVGTLIGHAANPVQSWFAIDGSATHAAIKSWHRGWQLSQNRRSVLIQDEITSSSPVDAWWFAHTAAKITISADGRSATLTLSGKSLLARIITPDATFLIMAARPLWTSPDPAGQSTNAGITKLAVRMPGITTTTLAIELIPQFAGTPVPSPPQVLPISQWPTADHAVATVSSIKINNAAVEGFAEGNFSYGVDLTGHPAITATPSDPQTTVKVLGGQPGQSTRVLATRPGRATGHYLIWPDLPLGLGNFPSTIIASSDDGDVPANTMDGNPATRWSAQGNGQWIAYDMGSDGPVSSIRIAWYSGSTRTTTFDVQVAAAGATSWTTVFSGKSSGTTDDFETYQLTASTARYLRIVGHGNSASDWNSITEVQIVGRSVKLDQTITLDTLALAIPAVGPGRTVQSAVTGTMTDGSAADLSGVQLSYQSLDTKIATVSSAGAVTGVGVGETYIAVIGQTTDHRLLHSRTRVQVADPDRPRFAATADTYVRDGSYANDASFGDDPTMVVKYAIKVDQGFNRRGFIDFAPAAQTRTVKQVLLHFQAWVADNNGTETDLTLRLATGSIDERTTTWNNQPGLGDHVGVQHVTSVAAPYAVDITAGVLDLAQKGQPFTIALVQEPKTGEGLATQIASRESGNGAYLEVVLG